MQSEGVNEMTEGGERLTPVVIQLGNQLDLLSSFLFQTDYFVVIVVKLVSAL